MATLVTRSGKGSPLTHAEVDANFTNLNTDKLELSGGTMTGNLSFGDNDKAIFGAGSDLQIYHDGSNSYISDQGTGDLRVLAGQFNVKSASGNTDMIYAVNGDAVTLYHNGNAKLATTSTGVDITGTLTSDALTVDGLAKIQGVSTGLLINETDTTDVNSYLTTSGGVFKIFTTNDAFSSFTERLRINHSSGDISFYEDTGTTAKFFWDASSERLGIGTSSPASILHANGTDAEIRLQSSSQTSNLGKFRIDPANNKVVLESTSTHALAFNTNGSERMRIDSSGNLLVGTTDTSLYANTTGSGFHVSSTGWFESAVTNDRCLYLNRMGTDGDIVQFRKDGTTVGSIGVIVSDILYIANPDGSGVGLNFDGDDPKINPTNGSGSGTDGVASLGWSGGRFDDIYATNGTIQTSDQNEKQDIAELSDAEQRVAVAAKGLLRKFRWKDKVAEKGDEARTHFGIIAQDLQAAFAAEGLDAGDYAMFIHTTWTDEETGEERSRMGVRYSELLAFIIAAI